MAGVPEGMMPGGPIPTGGERSAAGSKPRIPCSHHLLERVSLLSGTTSTVLAARGRHVAHLRCRPSSGTCPPHALQTTPKRRCRGWRKAERRQRQCSNQARRGGIHRLELMAFRRPRHHTGVVCRLRT